MSAQPQTSAKARAAFVLGLLSLGSGFLALVSETDFFLLGLFGCPLAILLGVRGWREVGRSSGRLTGKALAGWGIGLPVGGFCLGFLLLPAG
jgi:hypothetical protein